MKARKELNKKLKKIKRFNDCRRKDNYWEKVEQILNSWLGHAEQGK